MTKEDALKLFYAKNSLDEKKICDIDSPDYDDRLKNLSDQIDHWLQNIDAADQECFLECLSRYTYLTEFQCQKRFAKIIELLNMDINGNDIDLSEVLFVTVQSDSGRKSGGDNVRVDLQKRNCSKISKKQILESHSKISKEELEKYKAIVFVDDIIGSGCTFWRMFDTFQEKFPEIENLSLYYACIIPTKKGIKHIEKNFKVRSIRIKPVFDESWYQDVAFSKGTEEYRKVEKYEKEIDKYFEKSFAMGFNKARLLTSFYYNTPNNTISSFWREAPSNQPPFKRDGNQSLRPRIEDLKQKKKAYANKAYSCGIVREQHNG